MKKSGCAALAGLFILAGCESYGGAFVDNSAACDEIVDSRARLDCYERAEQAEDEWREERRREREEKARKEPSAS
ncbi:MAG: hypothetical protein CME85_05830 [Henriciella sp.]|jgi:hypothetical protein|uniref:hypothetical protein n=1 Tax=Henriciella sp. TaxID=1968823 RepID=UPI000C0C69B1|nr:hypothetical protein [Henriciella sp.]MBK75003.1 hypothetical protein [Henriciella sp.]PHR75065.1 MAG: hypothetical protein COA64_12830 [Henriciella sp.]|tara:strand:+ start:493 stop:717 length:225 start_codon:yes stop_codon:yes gene_type:complete